MPRLAFLSCAETLPSAQRRRSDAHEHDHQVAALRAPLGDLGIELEEVDWVDRTIDWSRFDAAIIGTTWNYQHAPDRFVRTLETIGDHCPVWNPLSLVEWNLSKRYLASVAEQGVATVPTAWVDEPSIARIEQARRSFRSPDVVVKLQMGANSEGQHRYTAGSRVFRPPTQPVMVQPFLSSVLDEGELSFVFVDGTFSHAVAKKPTGADYRVQSAYGGREHPLEPREADLQIARAAHATIPGEPLYARVDLIRGPEGVLLVMEIEVIEPYLYPEQGPELGPRLAAAIDRRLSS